MVIRIAIEQQFYDNINVLECIEKDGIKIEILEYKSLRGLRDVCFAENLYYLEKAGMSLKQVKVTLRNSSITTERGALYFHKGRITAECETGSVSGLAKKLIKNKLTNESAFTPTYSGTGEVFLEPSFSHFILLDLDNDAIIVDKGMFYCCESGVNVEVAVQKNLSSGLFGGEGWFQTKISGTGLCVLAIPVPPAEVLKYELNNERMQVDGNFVFLRSASVNFTVERSAKNLVGNLTSGEGALQTFEGTGIVWMAPTQFVYGALSSCYYPPVTATKSKSSSSSDD
ncbi:AIM24 family protein [Methanosarcina sp. KYL-1]|uniref:AIM24 family protein n=1 Tax=Methanosarcina sp. KYL-1 TaxID=2602068 RepID=UPI002100B1B0|nr:AIM24 family protein [Methanosarcina sp. KYL-1]MCQ1534597.1 AIM24 family protein [Methanosarcina sp. KYL-1]